jgi:branched-chain amino acid transport system ATP-binding protein
MAGDDDLEYRPLPDERREEFAAMLRYAFQPESGPFDPERWGGPTPPDHPGERFWPAIARSPAMNEREQEARARAMELLEVFDLAGMVDEYAAALSGGQRKLLELARALMLDPQLLLLDEPFAGVNPTLTAEIADHIRSLNDDGLTLLIIEHELETLIDLVDRLIVLANGQLLSTGTPAEILEDELVIEAYLGG